ncbi:MAG: hypothetical protein NTX86_04555 [Candidatus Dependentiae bacterium]|nr:hypothetical protein [Candidatus Dependentiae bacterium]
MKIFTVLSLFVLALAPINGFASSFPDQDFSPEKKQKLLMEKIKNRVVKGEELIIGAQNEGLYSTEEMDASWEKNKRKMLGRARFSNDYERLSKTYPHYVGYSHDDIVHALMKDDLDFSKPGWEKKFKAFMHTLTGKPEKEIKFKKIIFDRATIHNFCDSGIGEKSDSPKFKDAAQVCLNRVGSLIRELLVPGGELFVGPILVAEEPLNIVYDANQVEKLGLYFSDSKDMGNILNSSRSDSSYTYIVYTYNPAPEDEDKVGAENNKKEVAHSDKSMENKGEAENSEAGFMEEFGLSKEEVAAQKAMLLEIGRQQQLKKKNEGKKN